MQEGIVHAEAAERARQAGILVIMNRCMLKEHLRRSRQPSKQA
jgi:predicted CoA-binding protein